MSIFERCCCERVDMTSRGLQFSPSVYARVAGAFYLYIIVVGIWAEMFVRSKLVVSGDSGATATNILSNEVLFRLGAAGELLHLAFDVCVAAIFYVLFRRVDRILAMIAALMRLACDLVLAVASVGHFAALRMIHGGDSLSGLDVGQRQALALFSMRLHGDAYAISLVFFSFACVSLGWLIVRSSLVPRLIGWMLMLAGVCYFVNSFAGFLGLPMNALILIPCFFAELFLALSLLVKGVDSAKWEALESA